MMSHRGGQQQNAASGALDRVVSVAESWRTWRVGHPIRAVGGVTFTRAPRPGPSGQSPLCACTKIDSDRVVQEWWLPPFLVPTAEVVRVAGRLSGKAVALPQYSAASGAAGR
eukprot:4147859-Pyramimonas_sp.AAC.1